jgi:hypothetical protein
MNTINVEQQCKILQSVAENYSSTTSEYQAVELGAKALMFLFINGQIAEFSKKIIEFDEPDDREDEEVLREARERLRGLATK